jgi:membrane AbrB-like protein
MVGCVTTRTPPFRQVRTSSSRVTGGFVARGLVVVGAVVATAAAFGRVGLPSPYLLAALAVGIAYALVAPWPLHPPLGTAAAAQGVIGVTAGSYLTRSTLSAVGAHLLPIAAISALTVAVSVLAGLVLARFSSIDRPTAAFGMIAGGAAGIVALSRELGADERLVAVMQYVRVMIIVVVTPTVAIGVFGMRRATHRGVGGALWSTHGVVYVALAVCAGLAIARRLRLPGGTILGPMLAAAAVSLVYRPLVAPIPVVLADTALVLIGLDVGLRFTLGTLRSAGVLLPRAIVVIAGMLVISAGFGLGLTESTNVSGLDGYLATTPGGLTAVIAMSVGSNTNTTFIVAVQVIRTFLMLAAVPALATWLTAARPEA